MKKYFLLIMILFFIAAPAVLYSYSFEMYCNDFTTLHQCAPYPYVSDVQVNFEGDLAIITATITDISGVNATTILKVPDGTELPPEGMFDDGAHFDGDENDGVFGMTSPALVEGQTYTVDISTFDFLGNNSGNAYDNIISFTVSTQTEIDPLEIIPPSVERLAEVAIRATLKRVNGGTPIADEIINFYSDEQFLGSGYCDTPQCRTNSEGVATWTHQAAFSPGEHTIKAAYTGSLFHRYNPSFAEEILEILPESTIIIDFSIDGQAAKNIIRVGEIIKFSARLTDANSLTGLEGKTIRFSDQTDGVDLCENVTNSSGYTDCWYTVPVDITVGYHTLEAVFDGDDEYSPVSAEKVVHVPVKDNEMIPFDIFFPDEENTVGLPVSFSVNLNYIAEDPEIDSTPLPEGRPVGFFDLTSGQIFNTATDEYGDAFGTFDAVGWPAGIHGLQAVYAGDSEYNYSTANRNFEVYGPTIPNPFKSYNSSSGAEQYCFKRNVGGSIKLKTTLKFLNPNGTPVSGVSVTFSDLTSGANWGAGTTNSAGIAEITHPVLVNENLGCHNLKALAPTDSTKYTLESYNDSLWVRIVAANGTCAGKPPCP